MPRDIREQIGQAAPPEPLEAASVPGGRVRNTLWQRLTSVWAVILSLAGVGALFCFIYAFWALFETVSVVLRLPETDSVLVHLLLRLSGEESRWPLGMDGWSLDAALCFGVVTTLGLIYLIWDRISALGNDHAQALLRTRARQVLGELPDEGYFVEVRGRVPGASLAPELGWLFLHPEKLHFVGETVRLTAPRSSVSGEITLRGEAGGLWGTWVQLPLSPEPCRLAFLARGGIARLSDSTPLAEPLRQRLMAWQAGRPAPDRESERQDD